MEKNLENINVIKLAFLGDTMFDMFTRKYLIEKYADTIKMQELHKKNSMLVCAKSQARIVERLIDDEIFASDEIEFYKHARNAHPHSKSKNSSIVDYRKATGFEALLAYIFYKYGEKRLNTVFAKIEKVIEV